MEWLCGQCLDSRLQTLHREIANIHAQPPPATTTLYLDLEGSVDSVVELGIVIFKRVEDVAGGKILCASVTYGAVIDEADFWRGRHYCHGLNSIQLQEKGKSQADLGISLRRAIILHNVNEVVGSGPDIPAYLRRHSLPMFTYRDCTLPRWSVRVNCSSHQRAREAKQMEHRINGVCCKASTMHNHPVHFRTKERVQHRAHCALYDALELCLYDNPDFALTID